jgi:predicted metal-dependent HD superfamily phosphohydrolase
VNRLRLLDHATLYGAARAFYAEPQRGYHDVGHLDELIALAREHAPDLDDAEQLALLFHDAVYAPGAPPHVNERLSALTMRAVVDQMARDGALPALPSDVVDRAARIVEATAHVDPPTVEASRVCDLDLWRLAAPWEQFERDSRGVRREYRHLFGSDEAFAASRRAFCARFLQRPTIYATAYFRERFEARARANLERASRPPV